MVRIKRVFGRIRQNRAGAVLIADTPEIARDIEWLLDRHPLGMDDATRTRLAEQAERHRRQEQVVLRILDGQPVQLGLEMPPPARPPREYQRVAADLAIATGRLLVTDSVGLGKTYTGLLVLRAPDALPALVVTLTHLPQQWCDEIAETLPWLRTHIAAKAKAYDPTSRPGVRQQPDVLVLNYAKLAGWADHLRGMVRTVIFDEAQELRRSDSAKYEAAAIVADGARYRVGLTASPVYNYGGEIYNVLNVLAPDALGTREEFIREWGASLAADDTKVAVRDPAALGAWLRDQGLMLGRTRKEVGRELPALLRIPQTVNADTAALDQLSGDAVEMARLILDQHTSSTRRWQAAGDLDWRLRQATGIAKAPYVAEFVRMLLDSEDRVVLFGWHRAVFDLWIHRLAAFRPALYTGTESPAAKQRSVQAFLSGRSRVLIMSLRAGAGLDGLQEAAHVAVFGELDWSPQVHAQCLGRLHRDGQQDPVLGYFLVAEEGSDPVIAEVLHLKRMQSEPMLSPDGRLFEEVRGTQDRVRLLAAEVLRRHGRGAATLREDGVNAPVPQAAGGWRAPMREGHVPPRLAVEVAAAAEQESA